MNDKQRDYLMKKINNTFNQQVQDLNKKRPVKPSLNNYLIAAFLDGSIQFNDIDKLKQKMRKSVIKMGKGVNLVETSSNSSMWQNKEETAYVKVLAEDIFILPQSYLDELKVYQKEDQKITDQIAQLSAQLNTIEIKITLGSNGALDKLIGEADNLGEISLINSKLLLLN